MNNNFVVLQRILYSVSSPAALPVECANNQIRLINHITISCEKTSAPVSFRNNHGFVGGDKYFISSPLVFLFPQICLSRKRNGTFKIYIIICLPSTDNLFCNPCIKAPGNAGNKIRKALLYQTINKTAQSSAEFKILSVFAVFRKRHLFRTIAGESNYHKYHLNNQ